MTKPILTLFILFNFLQLSQNAFAQNFNVYGLWFEQTGEIYVDTLFDPYTGDTVFVTGGITGNQHLMSLNPFNGQTTTVGIIDEVEGVSIGSSTFDQTNERYIFWAYDVMSEQRIYNIELNTAFITNDAPLNNNSAFELQYDLQSSTLYGMRYELMGFDSLGNAIGMNYFLSINENTGQITEIAEVPDLQGVVVGTSCFNSSLGHYYFVGKDSTFVNRLYTINSADGTIINDALVPNDVLLNELHYDHQDSIIFGLKREQGGGPFSFISIDPVSAAITELNDFVNLPDNFLLPIAASTYEQAFQAYVVMTIIAGQRHVLLIDAPSGSVISLLPVNINLIEIEANNKLFGSTFFVPSSIENIEEINPMSISPNPFREYINIEINDARSKFEIYDLNGILRESGYITGPRLELDKLPSGTYFLNMSGRTEKIIKIQ